MRRAPVCAEAIREATNMLRTFSMSTAFTGPKFAAMSKTRLDAAIWLLVIVVCAVFFVIDIADICTAYARQEAQLSVRLESSSAVLVPQPVLCVEFDRRLFALRFVTLSKRKNSSQSDFKRMLKHRNGSDACLIHDIVEQDGNVVIFQAAYMLLTLYMDNDLENFNNYRLYSTKMLALLRVLERCFERQRVNYVDLLKAIGKQMCRRLHNVNKPHVLHFDEPFEVFGSRDGVHQRRCAEDSLVWLGASPLVSASGRADLFCHHYSMADPNQTSYHLAHPILINYAYVGLYETSTETDGGTKREFAIVLPKDRAVDPKGSVFAKTAKLRFDLSGGAGIMDPAAFDKAVSIFPIYTSASIRIRTLSAFERYDRADQPCSKKSRFECAKRCKAAAIFRARDCWPLSFFSGKAPQGVKVCTDHPVRESTANVTSWQSCLDNCWPQCNEKLYSLTQTVDSSMHFEYVSEVTLYPEPTLCPVVTERLKMDAVGLLAAIGGSAGLWLGGSLFALLHSVIFPLQYFVVQRARRKKTNAPDSTPCFPTSTKSFLGKPWAHFVQFCDLSPLHAFCFIGNDMQTRASRLLWLMLSSLFVLMTIRDAVTFYDKYSAEPVTFRAAIVFGESARVDNLSICFGLEAEVVFAHLTVKNILAKNNGSDPPLSVLANSTLAAMKTGRFSKEFGEIPSQELRLLYAELLSVTAFDTGCALSRREIIRVFNYHHGNQYRKIIDAFELSDFHQKSFRNLLKNHSITHRLLSDFISDFICRTKKVSMEVRKFDETTGQYETAGVLTPDDLCRPNRIRSITDCSGVLTGQYLQTCIRIADPSFALSPRDQLVVRYETHTNSNKVFWTTRTTLDLRSGVGSADKTYSDGVSLSGNLFVSIAAQFVLENRTNSRCDLQDHRECTEKCHLRAVQLERNCTPVEQLQLANSSEVCNHVTSLADVFKNLTLKSGSWESCAKDCAASCEIQLFQLTRSTPSTYDCEWHNNVVLKKAEKSITVKLRSRPFLRIVEQLEMSYENALINVGGAIALWFGASVVAILHIPLHIFFTLCRKDVCDRTTSANVDEEPEPTPTRTHESANSTPLEIVDLDSEEHIQCAASTSLDQTPEENRWNVVARASVNAASLTRYTGSSSFVRHEVLVHSSKEKTVVAMRRISIEEID